MLIRKRIEIDRTPLLYCLLGDVTRKHEFYEEAWNLSGGRFARAQRSLGNYYFAQGEYRKSIEAFDLALRINPMYDKAWFKLGCAAIQVQAWEQAQSAFLRVVALDPEEAQAWSNLATAHLRCNRV